MIQKKICVITGTRAEYGNLRWILEGIQNSSKLDLQIIATGMHLSPEFGLTHRLIKSDGFIINKKVEMLVSSDTSVAITKSMGLGMIGLADAIEDLQPDLILVLGDRYEIFSAVSAAMISRIPVAHLHGGESTEGLIDEPIRHSITKMSHFHFVANQKYKKRVLQLGEKEKNIFLVGTPAIDSIFKLQLLDISDLQKALDFKLGKNNLLITFHPVTLEKNTSEIQMKALLAALGKLKQTHLVFTMPNADTDGRILFKMIEEFVLKHKNAKAFKSLGQLRYLTCLKYFDGVVGNSSSGLVEAPSFNTGTINIGDRQKGRIKAKSIIDCKPNQKDILNEIKKLFSDDFQKTLKNIVNPYGEKGASKKIVKILENLSLQNVLKKEFQDLDF